MPVRRTGNLSLTVHVDYSCRDGLARRGEDYEAQSCERVIMGLKHSHLVESDQDQAD